MINIQGKTIFGNQIVMDGLIMYLDVMNIKSNPNQGTYLYDISGYGNDLHVYNSPTYHDKYIEFDGTNQYGIVNDGIVDYNRSDFSIGGWIYYIVDPLPYYGIILSKWTTGGGINNEFYFGSSSSGYFSFALQVDPDVIPATIPNRQVDSITVPTTNKWFYMVGTYDNGVISIYVNGVLENSATNTEYTSVIDNGSNSIFQTGRFGSSYYSRNAYRNGLFVYNKALSETEVLQNYNAQKNRYI